MPGYRANRRHRGTARHESNLASRFRSSAPILIISSRYGNCGGRAFAHPPCAGGRAEATEGWALDPKCGRPTTDPAVRGERFAAANRRAKGLRPRADGRDPRSALSDGEPGFQVTYENMVKRPSNICQFFLVLNPDGFAGSERDDARVTHIAEVIGKAKAMEGEARPRLPGARGHAVKRKVAAEGIAMFGNLRQRAQQCCRHAREPHGDGMKAYEVRVTTGLDGLVLNLLPR